MKIQIYINKSEFLSDRKVLYGPYRFHIARVKETAWFDNYDLNKYYNWTSSNNCRDYQYIVRWFYKDVTFENMYKETITASDGQAFEF